MQQKFTTATLLLANQYIEVVNKTQVKRYNEYLKPLTEIEVLNSKYTNCMVSQKNNGYISFGISKDVISIINRMYNQQPVTLREKRIAHFFIARNVASLYLRDYAVGLTIASALGRFKYLTPKKVISIFENTVGVICEIGLLKIGIEIPDVPAGDQKIIDELVEKGVDKLTEKTLYNKILKSVNLTDSKDLELHVKSLSMMKEIRADIVAITLINNYMNIMGIKSILDNNNAFNDIFSFYNDSGSTLNIGFPSKTDRIFYANKFGYRQYNLSGKAQKDVIIKCVNKYKLSTLTLKNKLLYLYKHTTGFEQEWFRIWLEFMNNWKGEE